MKRKLEEVENARNQVEKAMKEAEKAREEAEKAREEAQQEGYDIGVVEIEEALMAEVSRVCRNYCLQVWNEALNQAGVEASSVLRKAENVYYPPVIRAASSSSSKANAPPFSSSPPKVAKEPGVNGKEAEMTMEVALNAT